MNARESLTTLGIYGIVPPAALCLTPPSLSYVIRVLFSSRSHPRAIYSKLQLFSWIFNSFVKEKQNQYDNDMAYANRDKPEFVKYLNQKDSMDKLTSEQVIEFLQIVFDKPCKEWYDNEKKTQTPLPWEVCKKTSLSYVLDIA